MCAKVSASVARAALANGTPRRNAQQTPSKIPRGRRTGPTQNQSRDSSESEDENQSSRAGSSHDDSIDFLGQPPSDLPTESNAPNDTSGETNSGTQESSPRQTTRVTNQRPNIDRRKQQKPKKRKNRVTKELVHLQSTTKLLIPRLPFQRLVREILQNESDSLRVQSSTLECLQEAAESYLTQLFEDSYLCCLHRSRITLSEKDIKLVQLLRGPLDAGRR